MQEFGTSVGPPAGAREVVTACRELIRAMTGMADATGGGMLRTAVVGGGSADGGATSCRLSVVGDRLLIGTLIGIGTAPVPLA